MSVDILKRQVQQVQILAFDRYDRLQADVNNLLNLLTLTIDNRASRENPVRLEEDFFFPEAYSWEDEMVTMPGLDKLAYTVPIKGYSALLPYNRVNIGRPNTIAQLERLVPRLGDAQNRLQLRKAMSVFRGNPLSVDGQNFFADAHVHPAGKGTYDNILAPNWADPAAPTDQEVRDIMESIRSQFATNLTIDAEVIDSSQLERDLLIFVHNAAHETSFRRAKNDDTITIGSDQVPNPNKGTFTLLRDVRPTSGQENYLEAVRIVPGGPRPVIRVIDAAPTLDVIENNKVSNALVYVSMEQQFGMKAGDPSTAMQVQPT